MDRFDAFTLAPLSAGDIIDRAVRLYRRHFVALLRIVLAPSLIAYVGSIALTIGQRNFSLARSDGWILLSGGLIAGGLGVYLIGKIAFFVVLGGMARALVNYFLDGSPLRARDVYRAVRERLWSLVGATLLVFILLAAVLSLAYVVVILVVTLYVLATTWLLSGLPEWAQVSIHIVFAALFAALLLALFLLVYGRILYVPQALMVEGKGVFSAVSRSLTLAGRDVRRIGAIFLFWFYVAISVYLLLLIPLNWYAYWNGVDINPFGAEKPLWYTVATQTLTQLSEILLMPIAMLSFTLLYIDSRVRKEGFDVELLANRRLPAAAFVPPPVIAPPVPAAASSPFPSILGLNDYRPAPLPPEAPARDPAAIPLAEAAPAARACQSCGTSAAHYDRFCRRCGALIEQELEVRS